MLSCNRINFSDLHKAQLQEILSGNTNALLIKVDGKLQALIDTVLKGNDSHIGANDLSFPWHVQAKSEDGFRQQPTAELRALPGKDLRLSTCRKIKRGNQTDHHTNEIIKTLDIILDSLAQENGTAQLNHYEVLANLYPDSLTAANTFLHDAKPYLQGNTNRELQLDTKKRRTASRLALLKKLLHKQHSTEGASDTSEIGFVLQSLRGRIMSKLSTRKNQTIVLGPHFDRQCFTLVCGCRRSVQTQFFHQGKWKNIPIQNDEAILFTGLQGVQFGYKPLLHRVIIDENELANMQNEQNLTITLSADIRLN